MILPRFWPTPLINRTNENQNRAENLKGVVLAHVDKENEERNPNYENFLIAIR